MDDQYLDDYELFADFPVALPLFGSQVPAFLRAHGPNQCSGEFCCIHNPSDHPLNRAQMLWRDDRKLIERLCDHGVGHPDPDDIAHKRRFLTAKGLTPEEVEHAVRPYTVHGCDGCCRP